jgi:hypothetical protein
MFSCWKIVCKWGVVGISLDPNRSDQPIVKGGPSIARAEFNPYTALLTKWVYRPPDQDSSGSEGAH